LPGWLSLELFRGQDAREIHPLSAQCNRLRQLGRQVVNPLKLGGRDVVHIAFRHDVFAEVRGVVVVDRRALGQDEDVGAQVIQFLGHGLLGEVRDGLDRYDNGDAQHDCQEAGQQLALPLA